MRVRESKRKEACGQCYPRISMNEIASLHLCVRVCVDGYIFIKCQISKWKVRFIHTFCSSVLVPHNLRIIWHSLIHLFAIPLIHSPLALSLSLSPSRQKFEHSKYACVLTYEKLTSSTFHTYINDYICISNKKFSLLVALSKYTSREKKMHCCAQNVLNSCGKWKQYHTVKWTSENTTWTHHITSIHLLHILCNTNGDIDIYIIYFRVSFSSSLLSLFNTIYGLAPIQQSDHPLQWFASQSIHSLNERESKWT